MVTELRKAVTPDHLEQHRDQDVYLLWQEQEGVKVIRDYKFEDLEEVELGPWERKGGKGAIIVLSNRVLASDLHLVEISPGGQSAPEHHMYEEVVYVRSGQGTTNIWVEGGPKQIIEWGAGSLFTIPLNTWYQHFNGSGTRPGRYAAVTNLPPTIRVFKSTDFIFNNPYQFTNRYSGQESDFFNGEGTVYRGEGKNFTTIWKTNFIPNVDTMPLWEYSARGAGGVNTHFRLDGNVCNGHASEFPVGTYKKAHVHGPGAHLVICGGVGFSLLWWANKEERVKVDWKKGGLVIVPYDATFHQHFNTGPEPARYLALGGGDGIPGGGPAGGSNVSIKEGGWQVEYEDEDPEIHQIFESELKKNGVECLMKDYIPSCTGRSDK